MAMTEEPAPGQDRVAACVEAICVLGCARVREVIADLQAGRPVAAAEQLDPSLRLAVLRELESIMAVYDRPCPVPARNPGRS